MNGHVLAATTVAAALLLAGCSSAGTSPPTEPPAPGTSSGTAAPVQVDGTAWEHVHGLALDGQRLVVGTHQGLWGQDPGRLLRRGR